MKISPHVFTDLVTDPNEKNVIDAVDIALANECDAVIGFGGGSSMDVAKLVSVLINKKQSLSEIYGVDQINSARASLIPARAPLIQVPTTAGTGSEVTGVAIITTGESEKKGVVSSILLADAVFLDPELTIGLPSHTTAITGIDAMVHAIEAITSEHLKNPMSHTLALKALNLLSSNIRTAVSEGQNIAARSDMLLGAMLAGQAFANAPVAAVHALAYPLGGIHHISHGLSNSLVLPHVLRFNGEQGDQQYTDIAKAINTHGLMGSYSQLEASCGSASEFLAIYFETLAKELTLPIKLREVGVVMSDLPRLADNAMLQERLLINNPRDLSYDQILKIYQKAF